MIAVDDKELDLEKVDGWKDSSFGEEISNWCRKYADHTAVIENNTLITYRELGGLIEKTANGFINSGLKPGDRAVLQLPNGLNYVLCFFGLLKAGVIPVLTLPAHRNIELQGIIDTAKPAAYIYQDNFMGFDYSAMSMQLFEEFDCLRYKFEITNRESVVTILETEKIAQYPEISGNSVAFLSLSGGTTGIPKLIPRTHADYLYDTEMSVRRCELTQADIYLVLLPMPHNFILGHPGFIGTLSKGSTLVINQYADINEGLELIEKHKVTVISLVPSMVKLMLDTIEDEEYDLSSLRIIQVGGAFFEESIAVKLMNAGDFKLQQVFGVAEGLNTMTSLTDDAEIIKKYQGKPISEYDQIMIVNEEGIELPKGEYGELLIKGLYTIHSYYNNFKNQDAFTATGFYRTGDRAMVEPGGNLKISGRVYEMINKSGEKIIPSEIESYLINDELIKDCSVVGLPDESQGEIICVFIIGNENVTLDYVRKYLIGKNIAHFKLPDKLILVEQFPLTKVGKVNKKELIRMGLERV